MRNILFGMYSPRVMALSISSASACAFTKRALSFAISSAAFVSPPFFVRFRR